MTRFSDEDVRHLAHLSNLRLTADEAERLRSELEHIIGYIQQLDELDTTGIDPTYQVTDLYNVWRPDQVDTYGIDQTSLLKLAPSTEHEHIKVPKVL